MADEMAKVATSGVAEEPIEVLETVGFDVAVMPDKVTSVSLVGEGPTELPLPVELAVEVAPDVTKVAELGERTTAEFVATALLTVGRTVALEAGRMPRIPPVELAVAVAPERLRAAEL